MYIYCRVEDASYWLTSCSGSIQPYMSLYRSVCLFVYFNTEFSATVILFFIYYFYSRLRRLFVIIKQRTKSVNFASLLHID